MSGKLFCSMYQKWHVVQSDKMCAESATENTKNMSLHIWPICPIGKKIGEKASVVRIKKEVLGRLNGDQNDDIVSRNNKFRVVGREGVFAPQNFGR